jgi:hypothetical protein
MKEAALPAARAPAPRALELLACGTGLVLVMVLLGQIPSWRAELGTFQALVAVAFVFYAIALARLKHNREIPYATWIVLAVAAAARLALLPVTPSLSDDLYRYVWEGRVAAHRENPYALPPQAPELAPLREARIFPRLNHAELSAIYPPLAMAGFAAVSAISPTVLAMKLWIVLHDLALVALLVIWCRRRGLGAAAAIAYAWSPLVLVEFAGNGHNDPTAMVWLVAALMAAEGRPVVSALALACGVMTKLAPLAALPFLFARWPWRARAVLLVLLGAGLGAFVLAAIGPHSGLLAYARTWKNNELLFAFLATLAGDMGGRWLAAGIVLLVALLVWVRGTPPAEATRATLRTGLLVSPVAHPWYFGWAMVLEPLGRSPGWWLLSLTCVLSYGLLAPPAEGGAFHLPLAWRWVEYGAPLALWGALRLRTRT